MKPADFNFKNKPTNRLFLLLCLAGVALVAWWAWAAGPIRTKSAIQTGQNSQAQPTLSNPNYNPLQSASPSSGNSSTAGSASGSAVGTGSAPVSTQPSYPFCYPRGGIQPDIAYPCNCGGYGAGYPCCIGHPGIEIACPESTY